MQSLLKRWFPPWRRPEHVRERLARFYRARPDYTAMSDVGLAAHAAQINLLKTFLKPEGCYLDLGCGSGRVACDLARQTRVVGLDYGPDALVKASRNANANTIPGWPVWVNASADRLPFAENTFDGVYTFEVLEHLWQPEQAVRELIRVTRPGGFVLISMPNGFSIDWHLPKHPAARVLDLTAAVLRLAIDGVLRRPFWYCEPDLEGPVYPDCDRVTSVVPANLARMMQRQGCRIVFWDTYYMRAQTYPRESSLSFQRKAAGIVSHHFGDHLLLLARKNSLP